MLLSPLKSPHSFVCAEYLKRLISAETPIKAFLPFSGEVELSLLGEGRDLAIHTNNYVIYEFWSCFKTDPFRIADQAESLHARTTAGMIKTYQQEWPAFRDPYLRSAIFFLLNRYSEKGTLSCGIASLSNYTPMCLNRLRRCDESVTKINITYHKSEDYLEGIESCPNDGVALLMVGKFQGGPLGRQLDMGYETYPLNHRNLKKRITATGKKFILTYKAHRGIPILYREYKTIYINKFGKETRNIDLAEDMVVTNLGNLPAYEL